MLCLFVCFCFVFEGSFVFTTVMVMYAQTTLIANTQNTTLVRI